MTDENGASSSGPERDVPCPECGRGVHKDGSHTLSCSRRDSQYPWENTEDDTTEHADIPPKGLPEKWKDIAAGTEESNPEYAKALRRCANELEESDRYEHTGTDGNGGDSSC